MKKRSRSPSPAKGGLFSSSQSGEHPQHPPEKKLQISSKEVIEREPCITSGDLYIIRKIRLGQKPGSLIVELDRSMVADDTGILEIALDRLNELRERMPFNRQPCLTIKLKRDFKDDYLFNLTATKKEDMTHFIQFLVKQYHISERTGQEAISLFEQSYQPSSSVSAVVK